MKIRNTLKGGRGTVVMEDHEQQYDPEDPALLGLKTDQGYFEEL